ncbi:MAG: DUF2163 domain-containing protein [Hyphomicrobiales bacterium]|nr:DUF2163 domain-containing protein [Rickettsiales bacterium]MCP5362269.1 DUF2163 domain-containing protein [Hyphomicrobiales bacterium]
MKSISTALNTHLEGEVTTLATCWKITRRDSTVLGFTDHDQNITFESQLYVASGGFTPSAIAGSTDLAVDNLDVEGVLEDSSITAEDLLAGVYDFAEIEIFMVNYTDLTQGRLWLRRGWLGEVRVDRQRFVAEVRGLTQALSRTIGELFSPSCRAKLGDGRCKVNLASHTVTGTLTSVTDNRSFADSSRTEAAGTYDYGKITFTGGANSGLSMEVKTYSPSNIVLVLPMPYTVTAGDTYSLYAGCDKTLETCVSRFSNAVNFRGEPHVPGIDRMLETAGTRSAW